MIPVARPFLPQREKLDKYLEGIHERHWLTNNGPLVKELTERLQDYLGVRNLILVANGTLALQVAYKAFGVERSVVTTPFTFVATASSMRWQGITPRFADIDRNTLNLCPLNARDAVDDQTDAIVPVHVYGNACDVEAYEALESEAGVPVIYDASHAFGVDYKGASVLGRGSASTLSFHATKLFHTVEGGGIVFNDDEAYNRACSMVNFGFDEATGEITGAGLNAKLSEVHAAYGLSVLDSIDDIMKQRTEILACYYSRLESVVGQPVWNESATINAAYIPIVLETEAQCGAVLEELRAVDAVARRYFYPSLHEVAEYQNCWNDGCEVSASISRRVLCLPVYPGLTLADVARICDAVKTGCSRNMGSSSSGR